MIKLGTRVKLAKFNGTMDTPKDCEMSENFWSLIGEYGKVLKEKNERLRVLVQFENTKKLKALHCHNEIENSLWILETDIELA